MTARKPAKAWTVDDTAAMRELVALNWTDGRIAAALGVVRLTVWRRRTALGLDRADHPRKEGRVLLRGEQTTEVRSLRVMKGLQPLR